VLKHHLDQKAASTSATLLSINVSQSKNDDAFFHCIQTTHGVLTNPTKRRQFDSLGPAFLEEEEEKTVVTASEFKVGFSFLCGPSYECRCIVWPLTRRLHRRTCSHTHISHLDAYVLLAKYLVIILFTLCSSYSFPPLTTLTPQNKNSIRAISQVQPVSGLRTIDTTKTEVEGFHDFWYNFDSWRSFEWWDKEVNEGSDR
jgi:DnaJ family protein C protein 2